MLIFDKLNDKLNLSSFFGLKDEEEEVYEQQYEHETTLHHNEQQKAAVGYNQTSYKVPAYNHAEAVAAVSKPVYKEDARKKHTPTNVVKLNANSYTENTGVKGKRAQAVEKGKIIVIEPRVYSEAMNIAKNIICGESVIVNFRLVEEPQARRIVDFLTGTVYAMEGDIQRVGDEIFLCTPKNMEIDGVTAAMDIFGGDSQFFDD